MTEQGPWRGDGMRNTQEVAAREFLRAWLAECSVRRLAEEIDKLRKQQTVEAHRRDGHLMTIGELRFSTSEMQSLVRACTTGGEHGQRVIRVPGSIDFRIDPGIDDWQPKYPTYGGGFLEEDPDKRGQHPRPGPEPKEHP